MFCYNDSQETVAQSVSALCFVNLLNTMVVGSNPDDGLFLFCLFYFIFSSTCTSFAEISQNSHLFRQENGFVCLLVCFCFLFSHPKSAWSLTFWLWLKYTMCCTIDTIEAV